MVNLLGLCWDYRCEEIEIRLFVYFVFYIVNKLDRLLIEGIDNFMYNIYINRRRIIYLLGEFIEAI